MPARGVDSVCAQLKLGRAFSTFLLLVFTCLRASAQSGDTTKTAPCVAPKPHAHSSNTCSPCCQTAPQSGGATAFVVQQPTPTDDRPESTFKQSVPLLQSLIWPILIAALVVGFRGELSRLIDRIKSMSISTDGVDVELEPERAEPLSTAIPETMVIEEIRFE